MKRARPLFLDLLLLVIGVMVVGAQLASFPVFADEAIYIRWAQLARSNPDQYAFLPMLDGKPPLHVWTIAAALPFFADPVVAGRVVSVAFGAISAVLVLWLGSTFSLGVWQRRALIFFSLFTPYLFYISRLGLAEAQLGTSFLVLLLGLRLYLLTSKTRYALGITIGMASALMIKTSGLFLILPTILLWWFWKEKSTVKLQRSALVVMSSLFFGGALFGLLALHPIFPSLFSRSADYTFTIPELLFGEWRYVLFASVPRVSFWMLYYLTPFLLVPAFFTKPSRQLVIASVLYIAPIVILGRVLTTRYLFPMMPLMVLAGVMGLPVFYKKARTIFLILGVASVLFMVGFARTMIFDHNFTPFVAEDRQQYLEEWSSGHGLAEIRDRIHTTLEQNPEMRLLVATEGYFGTLPDGLQIYFDKFAEPERFEIYGVGQPILAIPEELREEAKDRTVWLVVNEHRFFDENEEGFWILERYPRPGSAPVLLLIEVLP